MPDRSARLPVDLHGRPKKFKDAYTPLCTARVWLLVAAKTGKRERSSILRETVTPRVVNSANWNRADWGGHIIDAVVTPEKAAKYANDLWAEYGPRLSPIVDVNLPDALHDRFKVFFDDLDLGTLPAPIPEWVMDLPFLVRLVVWRPTNVSGWLIALNVSIGLLFAVLWTSLSSRCLAGRTFARWSATILAAVIAAASVIGAFFLHEGWAVTGVLLPGILAIGVLITLHAPSTTRYFASINVDALNSSNRPTGTGLSRRRPAPKTRLRGRQ